MLLHLLSGLVEVLRECLQLRDFKLIVVFGDELEVRLQFSPPPPPQKCLEYFLCVLLWTVVVASSMTQLAWWATIKPFAEY